ncbi:MAG: hypothetical protein AAB249_09775 [Acidobacteriota bacterium]
MRFPGRLLVCAVLVAAGCAWPARASAGVVRVTISAPMPARIDMSGIRKILVTRFLVDQELPGVDLNKETVALMRRGMRKKTRLDILDVEPPPLPEQPLRELLANSGFWRRLAETHGADLVISGVATFASQDRSGFVTQDEISPVTGQRVRRTRFVDREGFSLGLNLFFLDGVTGRLLYEDHFTGENTLTGHGTDRLSVLYTLFEQFEDDIHGIVVPRSKSAQRFIFTD